MLRQLLIFSASLVLAMEPSTGLRAQDLVVSQQELGRMACGPCAIYHSLANGGDDLKKIAKGLHGETAEERIRAIIKDYGSRPSKVYPLNRHRYLPSEGVPSEDLAQMMSECLTENGSTKAVGIYPNREKNETGENHLRRVHQLLKKSLEAGVPPIVEFRSFAARAVGEKYKWFGLMGHFVVILDVAPVLPEGHKGFTFKYADSYTGKVEHGFLHLEGTSDFSATRKLSVSDNGTETWEWVTDYPYLKVTAPSLRLLEGKEPWHARTMVVLRYLIVTEGAAAAE